MREISRPTAYLKGMKEAFEEMKEFSSYENDLNEIRYRIELRFKVSCNNLAVSIKHEDDLYSSKGVFE